MMLGPSCCTDCLATGITSQVATSTVHSLYSPNLTVAECRRSVTPASILPAVTRQYQSVNKYLASLPVSIRSKVAERVAPDLSDLGIANRYLKKKDKRRSVAESVCEEADRVA